MAEPSKPRHDPTWMILLQIGALLILIAFRFAEPVGDGDLFWQMAYGKYLLANRTLIPDHTIYSWTPADNPYIYCSWFAEIVLYLMYQLGGLPLLFAFRYAMVLFTVGLAANFAYQIGWHRRCLFWLMVTWFVSASYVGTILKPELFSLGFMSSLAWLIFRFRLAARREQPCIRYLVALVGLMILWANTHGVYALGLTAIAAYAVGECLNAVFSPDLALPRKLWGAFALAVVASGLGVFLTPYGSDFVMQSLNEFLSIVRQNQSAGDKAAYTNLAAHLPVWKALAFHFHEYLALGVPFLAVLTTWKLCTPQRDPLAYPTLAWGTGILGVVSGVGLLAFLGKFVLAAGLLLIGLVGVWSLVAGPARGKLDWPFLLLNIWFALFFTIYLRSTFYWPPFFLYSSLYLFYVLGQQSSYRESAAEPGSWVDFLFAFANLGFLFFYFQHVELVSVYLRMEPTQAIKLVTLGGIFLQSATVVIYAAWRILLSPYDQDHDAAKDGVGYLEPRFWLASLCLASQLYLCGRNSYEAYYQPYAASWCGFGITYWNPVDEVEFLKKYHPDLKSIINDYDSGGYLIWALYPQTKVLIDPRSFPYRKFWADYIQYEHGQIGLEFLDRFSEQPQVSLVSLKNVSLWRSYLANKNWVPGWVGTAYIVFVKKGFVYPPDAAKFRPGRFETLRNGQKALQIFQFGIESNLYEISWIVLDVMKRKFNSTPYEKNLVANLEAYKDSIVALQSNNLDEAIAAQEKCVNYGFVVNGRLLLQMYQLKLTRLKKAGKQENDPEYQAALTRARQVMGALQSSGQ